MNLYVFNYTNLVLWTRTWLTKKISDRKNIQIRMKQRLHTERKNWSIRKGAPPWAQVCGNLYIYYKNISDTNQKEWIVRFFYIKITQKTIWKKRSYESICCAFRQPLSLTLPKDYSMIYWHHLIHYCGVDWPQRLRPQRLRPQKLVPGSNPQNLDTIFLS